VRPFPVVCVGHAFWDGLVGWLREVMLERYENISPEDMDLFRVTDDVEEAVQIMKYCYDDECWMKEKPFSIPGQAGAPTAEGTRSGINPGRRMAPPEE